MKKQLSLLIYLCAAITCALIYPLHAQTLCVLIAPLAFLAVQPKLKRRALQKIYNPSCPKLSNRLIFSSNTQYQIWAKKLLLPIIIATCLCLTLNLSFADTPGGKCVAEATTLGGIAKNVTCQLKDVTLLMIAISYLAGVGFTISAIYKFKQHKDNPTNVPVGTSFAILAVGILLMFLPGIFKPAARSVFGAVPTKIIMPAVIATS
jgi:hypothetical protein